MQQVEEERKTKKSNNIHIESHIIDSYNFLFQTLCNESHGIKPEQNTNKTSHQ